MDLSPDLLRKTRRRSGERLHHGYGIQLARWDGVSWNIETVDASARDIQSTSLVLDSGGSPLIAYCADNLLRLARWDGAPWKTETIDGGDVLSDSSLITDAAGNPAISYCSWSDGKLKFARWDGTTWNVETVDNGRGGSLALDESGNPAISYEKSPACLGYARWNGAAWTIKKVDASSFVCQWPSLSFDARGNPAISYHRSSPYGPRNGALTFARWDGTSWTTETIDNESHLGSHSSPIALR